MKRINNVMPIISGPCFGFAGIFVHELRIVLAKLVLSGKKQEVSATAITSDSEDYRGEDFFSRYTIWRTTL